MSTSKSLRLGILVPSSNTALEPLSQSIISGYGTSVSVHFSRFTVTQISLSPTALAQFDDSKIIAAAKLLADAKVDVIGWSGTSGGWLGFDIDEGLCRKITEATGGIPATTSTLALNKILEQLGSKDFGLVTPYLDDVQEKIVQTYAKAGFVVVAESHTRTSENVAIAAIGEDVLDAQVQEVAKKGAKIISTFCTNLRAAQRVEYWEKQHGIVVLDTVATVIWDMLKIAGWDTSKVKGWGTMFDIQ